YPLSLHDALPIYRLLPLGDSQSVVVLTRDADQKEDGFYALDLTTGRSTRLFEEGWSHSFPDMDPLRPLPITNDGKSIAYFAEDTQHPRELWVSDLKFKNPRRLTRLN